MALDMDETPRFIDTVDELCRVFSMGGVPSNRITRPIFWYYDREQPPTVVRAAEPNPKILARQKEIDRLLVLAKLREETIHITYRRNVWEGGRQKKSRRPWRLEISTPEVGRYVDFRSFWKLESYYNELPSRD